MADRGRAERPGGRTGRTARRPGRDHPVVRGPDRGIPAQGGDRGVSPHPAGAAAALRSPGRADDPAAVRRANFPDVMDFYAPGLKRWQTPEWTPENPRRFLPVSVTGSACALSCDHCQAKVLEGMISVRAGEDLFELARRLRAGGSEGLLVSGGSTRTGGVPLLPHLRHVPRIRGELGMKVIVHSGVVSPRLAEGLARAGVDGVMLDIIGADETLREVYHLGLTTADMERSLALLAGQGLQIIPHIVLGLHYGRFLGEHRALEMVTRYPVSTLILVVLTPGTCSPMAHIPRPPAADVASCFT